MARIIMQKTNIYISTRGKIMAQPMIRIGLHEKAFPIANVAVIKAVLGKTNENHAIEKFIRPGPMVDQ
jgi:hypothetical protein